MMKNNMIIYVSKDGNVKVDVNIQNEDIWMSQDIMALSFRIFNFFIVIFKKIALQKY